MIVVAAEVVTAGRGNGRGDVIEKARLLEVFGIWQSISGARFKYVPALFSFSKKIFHPWLRSV